MSDFITYGLNLHKERDADLIALIEARRVEMANRKGKPASASGVIHELLEVALGRVSLNHPAPEVITPPLDLSPLLAAIQDVAAAIRERPQVVYASPGEVPANGNGHDLDTEQAEDPNDELVRAMAGISFDF